MLSPLLSLSLSFSLFLSFSLSFSPPNKYLLFNRCTNALSFVTKQTFLACSFVFFFFFWKNARFFFDRPAVLVYFSFLCRKNVRSIFISFVGVTQYLLNATFSVLKNQELKQKSSKTGFFKLLQYWHQHRRNTQTGESSLNRWAFS